MKNCELCNSVARMYCDSDQAILCWDCDAKVHAANFLVAKHSRTLLCHACQSPTPWTGSGPNLGPAVSFCEICVHSSNGTNNNNDDDENNIDNDEIETDTEDDDGDDNSGDDGDGDEDDGENQVVPLSFTPPPPPPPLVSSSSNSEESLRAERLRSVRDVESKPTIGFSSKRTLQNPDLPMDLICNAEAELRSWGS